MGEFYIDVNENEIFNHEKLMVSLCAKRFLKKLT